MLRHTWIENRLILELQVDREEWLQASASDPVPRVLEGIPFQLERLSEILNSMIENYSPAQLVDRGPLGTLPEEVRALLRGALHEAYLASGEVLLLQQDLREAIENFSCVAGKIEPIWRSGDREAKNGLFNELATQASRLFTALWLPQGVILP
jgi:hypothetical protein